MKTDQSLKLTCSYDLPIGVHVNSVAWYQVAFPRRNSIGVSANEVFYDHKAFDGGGVLYNVEVTSAGRW